MSKTNTAKLSSLEGKDVTKNIYYVYSTMKTKDTEALGWQRAKTKQDQSPI